MRILDLFAGLGGWSAPARARGHDVTTLDFEPKFGCDFVRDILTVASLDELERGRGRFDVIFASPPCEGFSVAAMGRNWESDGHGGIVGPKTESARRAIAIARHTFSLIDSYFDPRRGMLRAVVENPIGAMRVAVQTPAGWVRRSTWQCQWGETRAKPTDLWTLNFYGTLPMCRAGAPDHAAAPRGSKTPGSTQGTRRSADRALIPYGLALAFILAAERGDGAVTAMYPVPQMSLEGVA